MTLYVRLLGQSMADIMRNVRGYEFTESGFLKVTFDKRVVHYSLRQIVRIEIEAD